MPIFDQGYQHWQGKLSGHATRWFTISQYGVRTQLRSRWATFLVVVAWVPALVLAAALVFWGLIEQKSSLIAPLMGLVRLPPNVLANARVHRLDAWTILYDIFFKFEIFFSMILLVCVAPGLISQDLRFNAMPLYFSRPLRRLDYFTGKLGVIAAYLGAVTILPALLAYVLGVCFSLDFHIVTDTARILGAVIAYSALIMLSAGMLILALSSLSRRSLYVGMFWVGLWLVGNMTAGVLTAAVHLNWGQLFSYTGDLERVGGALLGTRAAWESFGVTDEVRSGRNAEMAEALRGVPWYWSAAVLGVLLGMSIWILSSRVKSLDRLK